MSTRIKPAFIYSDRGRPYAFIGESLAFQGEDGQRLWVCWMKPAIGQVSLVCCRSNCNGLLSCHSLSYFDSLISPCAICSFTTFPCFPPCLSPPMIFTWVLPWLLSPVFHSSSPRLCQVVTAFSQSLSDVRLLLSNARPDYNLIFFLLTKKTLSVDLYWERNSLFAVTWSVPAILSPSTNTKQWQQQSKLFLFSSWGSQVWLASLSGNENVTELNHGETLYYI